MKSYRQREPLAFSNTKLSMIIASEGNLELYGKGGGLNPQILRVSITGDYDLKIKIIYTSNRLAFNSSLKKEREGTSTFQSINIKRDGLELLPADGGLADVGPDAEGPIKALPAVVGGVHHPVTAEQGNRGLGIRRATRDDGGVVVLHDDQIICHS